MDLVKGIDVSYYDFILNWSLYDNDFAFIKVSEGTVIDKVFKAQWKEARGQTIRGAYHFFRPFVDPKLAAETTFEYMDGDLGELPLVLDLETTDNRADTVARALLFLARWRQLAGKRPMIYTAPGFLDNIQAHNYIILEEYKLWLATYPFDKIQGNWTEEKRDQRLTDIWQGKYLLSFPPPPRPFKRVSFFQFTGKGPPNLIKGYQSNKLAVDFNLYNGQTFKELVQEFQIDYIPKPEGETMTIYGRVIAKTNIRNGPFDVGYQDIGDLPADTLIEASDKTQDRLGRTWYKLSKATNSENGPILTIHGKQVGEVVAWCFGGNVTEIGEPPTPSPTPEPTVTSIEIDQPKSVKINYSDGTSVTHP